MASKTSELKTLKNYEHNLPLGIDEKGNLIFGIKIDSLKREGIKWIKYIEREEAKPLLPDEVSVSEWIKHFFNISEKDLK